MNLEQTLAEALEEEKLTGKLERRHWCYLKGKREEERDRKLSLQMAWERELWEIWGQLFQAIFTKEFMNVNF